MEDRVQIDRFAVKNFRSIQGCDVELSPLTFFIGPNAAGKTSFVDAIQFVAAALRGSLQDALGRRGGIWSLLHHPISLPASSHFDFYLSSSTGYTAEFHLELRVVEGWDVSIAHEDCRIIESGGEPHNYVVDAGRVTGSAGVFPAVSADRIFLANASGLPEFRPVFDFLAGLAYVEPSTPGLYQALQALRRHNPASDEGTSLAGRLLRLKKSHPERLEIIQQYLRAIAPPFERMEFESGPALKLRFVERSRSGSLIPFPMSQSSAGLVSSAEILLGLFEAPAGISSASPVIVEEPEALLHPGAIQVIRDAFVEASRFRQVLVTTHSPDLLDDSEIPAEWIRSVRRDDDGTHIDMLDAPTKSVIRDHLFTAGQLLRQGALV